MKNMKLTNQTLVIGVVVVLGLAAVLAVAAWPGHGGPMGRGHGGPHGGPMLMMGGPIRPSGGPGMGGPGMGGPGMGGPGGGPQGGPPPKAGAATMVAYNGVVYVAAEGKVTALDAKTLNKVAEGAYAEGPPRGGR